MQLTHKNKSTISSPQSGKQRQGSPSTLQEPLTCKTYNSNANSNKMGQGSHWGWSWDDTKWKRKLDEMIHLFFSLNHRACCCKSIFTSKFFVPFFDVRATEKILPPRYVYYYASALNNTTWYEETIPWEYMGVWKRMYSSSIVQSIFTNQFHYILLAYVWPLEPNISFEFVLIPKPHPSTTTYAHPCPPMLFRLRPCIQIL